MAHYVEYVYIEILVLFIFGILKLDLLIPTGKFMYQNVVDFGTLLFVGLW